VIRWRCRNAACERQTFVDQLPEITSRHARRTCRAADIVRLLGHGVGGLPGERLMNRLGMPVSDDTILRLLKLQASKRGATTTVRVAGIDDWSWRKGRTYGTIVVDLERRQVVDVLPDRSTAGIAQWLGQRPRSKSSAATAEVCMRRAHARERAASAADSRSLPSPTKPAGDDRGPTEPRRPINGPGLVVGIHGRRGKRGGNSTRLGGST
jgi:transposase